MKQRENIRKINKGESFYDTFKQRSHNDNVEYKIVAGITQAKFSKKIKR